MTDDRFDPSPFRLEIEARNELNLSWPVDVLLDDGETRWLTLSPALGSLDRRATWSVHF